MYSANAITRIAVTPNKAMSVRSCSMYAPVLTQRESLVRCFLAGGYHLSSHANAHQRQQHLSRL
jgi:hypothetical protein